jgi:hypothetical protein
MSTVLNFVRPRWKAVMPLAAWLITVSGNRVADLDLSVEVKTLIASAISVVLVYVKRNTDPVPVA